GLLVDQRVGADRNLRVTARERLPGRLQAGLAHAACGQHRADTERLAERRQAQVMLLRECLRWRHQRRLVTALNRAQKRVQRDHRLARANIALQEPLHRISPRKITIDLRDRSFLSPRQQEGKRRPVASYKLTRRPERDRRLTARTSLKPRRLQRKQLVEGE